MDWSNRLGKRIKLRDLHILPAAAEAGSMVKAASDLAMSQPAVSYAVAEMEHALGVPLLERSCPGRGTDDLRVGAARAQPRGVQRAAAGHQRDRLARRPERGRAAPRHDPADVGDRLCGVQSAGSALPAHDLCPQRRSDPCPAARPAPAGGRSSSSAGWPISSPTRISTWIRCSTMSWR